MFDPARFIPVHYYRAVSPYIRTVFVPEFSYQSILRHIQRRGLAKYSGIKPSFFNSNAARNDKPR